MPTLPMPKDQGGDFEPAPAGTFVAICYRVIDLGTIATNFNGETKWQHKIMIGWEIPDELREDGKPFSVHKRYTWSMSERSNLRKDLESWRGAAFQERDFGPGGFEIKNILGQPCMLSIAHDVAKDGSGKVFANITSIGKLMKGLAVPQRVNKPQYLWISREEWDPVTFRELSETMQNKIENTREYKEMKNPPQRSFNEALDQGASTEEALDDDIPF